MIVCGLPPTRSDLVRGVRDNGRVMAGWSCGSRPAPVSPFRAAASLTGP